MNLLIFLPMTFALLFGLAHVKAYYVPVFDHLIKQTTDVLKVGVDMAKQQTKEIVDLSLGLAKDLSHLMPTLRGIYESSIQAVAGYPFELITNILNIMFVFSFDFSPVNAYNLPKLSQAIHSAAEISVGIVKDLGHSIPTAAGIFEKSKQALAAYPFEVFASLINRLCSSALSSKTISPKVLPDINKMQFQLRTACDRHSFPLLKAEEMWRSPNFDHTKKVVILATGWTTTVNETDTIDVFAKAYNCRGDVNFVAVDVASFVNTLYTWSALNTEAIGDAIAEGLVRLEQIVPIQNIHLIGHSLGAHIVGAAGRKFQYMTGKTIPRITGLDPAKPCFNEGENLSGLLRGDAEFIDVIHSNPGVLGKRDPMGDVDFYPGGLDPLPPGCLSVTCAHMRAWEYFAETVYPGNERNFMAVRCGSLTKLREDKCPGASAPMGYAVPHNIKGNYFLEVNSETPYGVAATKEREAINHNCGLCNKKAR